MTIQIELNADTMERLAAAAKACGIELAKYAETLLHEVLTNPLASRGVLSVEELHHLTQALVEGADKLPKLPASAFTRESFYEDRF
jgi:hypothetical protein